MFTFQDLDENREVNLPRVDIVNAIFEKCSSDSPLRELVCKMYVLFADPRKLEAPTDLSPAFWKGVAVYGLIALSYKSSVVADTRKSFARDVPWDFFLNENEDSKAAASKS